MKSIITILFFLAIGNSILPAQDKNISNGAAFDGEPYIAINPENSQHMVVAWLGWKFMEQIVIKTKASFDSGKSWSEVTTLPHAQYTYTSADPSLAFDADGNVFVAYVDFNNDIDSGAVYISKSEDGGLNWNNPVKVFDTHAEEGKKPIDRPWMVIDRSDGPNKGTIYITSMNAKGATSPFNPYLNYSTDGGATWENWQYIDVSGWLAGSLIAQPMPTPAVTADGFLHCIYPSYVLSQNILPQFIDSKFNNDDLTFEYHQVFESANTVQDDLAKKGYLIKADPADKDHLIFVFPGYEYDDIDVFFSETMDGGINWSEPVRVNDDPVGNGKMQDLIWADFDSDGDIVVTWRDRRNAEGSGYAVSSEIWGANRKKDSLEFSHNFRICNTQAEYDPILAQSGNDFMCVAFENDTINAVWGDARNGSLNIWMSRKAVEDDGSTGYILINSENKPPVNFYPNPVYSTLNITGKELTGMKLFNTMGELVFSKELNAANQQVQLDDIAPGTYILTIQTKSNRYSGKLVKK